MTTRKKVVVAMSGGVDSSVAAALLKEQGYDVYGVTMRLADRQESEERRFGGCCGTTDFYDARAVAQKLGIPHYLLNYVEKFRTSVIGYFKDAYLHGETPNPCIACNRFVKFDALLAQAIALGADYVATGHYARIVRNDGSADRWIGGSEQAIEAPTLRPSDPPIQYRLQKAMDPSKDQSYVLYHLGQKELARLLFPLGDLPKTEVRDIARRLGLRTAEKPDSQEICFVPNQDYRQFLREETPEGQCPAGPIRHEDGRVLGRHQGLPFYTVGQREGLGISVGKPLYVTALERSTNTLVVGEREDLLSRRMVVREVHWVAGRAPELPCRAAVKIRYKHQEAMAVLGVAETRGSTGAREHGRKQSLDFSGAPRLRSSGAMAVEFDESQSAITPGQAAVFYNKAEVLGGGVIDHAIR